MSNSSQADLRDATAKLERDLLARLGLGSGASNEQIENAHEEIAQYLDKAPSPLRAWSARQAASIDEAYALLRGDRAELSVAAANLQSAPSDPPTKVIAADKARANRSTPDAATAAPVSTPAASGRKAAVAQSGVVLPHGGRHTMDALDDGGDWSDEPELPSPPRKAGRRLGAAGAASDAPRRAINPALKRVGLAVAAAVTVVAVGFAGYTVGAPKDAPTASADPSGAALQEQVATLMQQLAANPNDVTTLVSLGTTYYEANDYQTAVTWMQKALAIEPNNLDALLAYGAASFNLGDYTTAETAWKQVIGIDPTSLEAYYDLGFLYFSDNPPNVEMTRQMWNKVIELSPGSDIANTVQSHLDSLDSASGSPAPGASGSAAASGSPAPAGSPAQSTAPASSAAPATSPAPAASPAPSPSK